MKVSVYIDHFRHKIATLLHTHIATIINLIIFPKEIGASINNAITSCSKQQNHASNSEEYPM